MKARKQLRPYQLESIESLREGISQGHTRQVLAASTGAGKSICAMHLIHQCVEKNKRIIFICDRRVLVEQFSRHLHSEGVSHGIIMAGSPRRFGELVQIASIQTLERMDEFPAFDLCIVDELHAVIGRKSLQNFLECQPKMKVIGLTATPFHPSLKDYFSSVTNVINMAQLVEKEYLVPFRIFAATEIDTKGVKVTAGEWQKDQLEERGLLIVGDVVSDYIKITNDVFDGRFRKTICFSSGVAHGAELVNKFAAAGLNFVQISYLDSEEYKADVLKDFAREDTAIQGVISTDILTRGFDQSDVEHVILAKPLRKAFSMHVQMVGRGARIHAGKSFCVLQDNSGNWLRFADSFDELYHEGVKTLDNGLDKKDRKEPTEKEKKEAKCPKCRTIWPAATDICPTCGYVRERKNMAQSVAGEMVELTPSQRKKKEKAEGWTTEYKTSFYQQLLQYARGKGYQDGWAFHKYRDKFGINPSAKKDVIPVGLEVYNWIQSRNIKHAKGRA